jgi:deoxyribodipyrimidine photo-lyase
VSIREVYWAAKSVSETLLKQLYWRDFYYQVVYHNQNTLSQNLKSKYDAIPWSTGKQAETHFQKWITGKTGFPLIDAGMRQMNETGFQHNRCRMNVASFLTKILRIDWRWGEQYFARSLIDYDPCVNNQSWQWAFGSGADAQPYFRFFNPWLQSKKFDPNATYIKKWIPELKDVPSNEIHNWYKTYSKYPDIGYPQPIVDYSEERTKNLEIMKKYLK